jgi:hypothetical protein
VHSCAAEYATPVDAQAALDAQAARRKKRGYARITPCEE